MTKEEIMAIIWKQHFNASAEYASWLNTYPFEWFVTVSQTPPPKAVA
jgi:hypothetical protein